MVHRGQIVKEKLRELGIKIKSIAPKVGYGNIYIYRKLEKSDLEWDVIRKIGLVIGYDFSRDFPDMPFTSSMLEEPGSKSDYKTNSLAAEIAFWKGKYIEALEKLSEERAQKKNEVAIA